MLPVRITEIASNDADALAAAQPERGRLYVRTRGGAFEGHLTERTDGAVGLLRESWSTPLRVRCARPVSYVAFSCVVASEGATWCGVPLGRRSVLEVEQEWELASRGAVESRSFAVLRDELEEVERRLGGGEAGGPPPVNRVLPEPAAEEVAEELRRRVAEGFAVGPLPAEAQAALRSDLLRFAARLRGWGRLENAHLESYSQRRAAVRRVEEYLDAYERTLPSVADLCAVAGVSERTLEYAFREQVGMPPGRYLRLRRLNGAREELRAAEPGTQRVTDVAMRWGFWQLGRFAGQYLRLFGELPSETLAGRLTRVRAPAARAPRGSRAPAATAG